jgi:hypothetical protein
MPIGSNYGLYTDCIQFHASDIFHCVFQDMVHLTDRFKGPITKPNNVGMAKMGVTDVILHHCAFLWWATLASNQRPLPCEGSALPLS